MTEIANHAGNEPWPSLEAASTWFDRASIVLAVSLLFGAAATGTIVWLGIVKEHHWDLLREQANGKIASVELEAAKSNAEAAKAHQRIAELSTQAEELKKDTAEANARAIEAQLALEKFRAPRWLDTNALRKLVLTLSAFGPQEYAITTFWDLKEPLDLSNQIHGALGLANWKFIPPPSGGSLLLGGKAGIEVWVHPTADMPVRLAANALIEALNAEQLDAKLREQNAANPKENVIRLNVGTKP